MKHKDYDEDLLVELIARNDRSYAQVAADVGISGSAAAYIGNGKYRRDLHPRIRAAAEKLPPDLRRRGAWSPGDGQGCPPVRKAPDYDDNLIAELLARNDRSYGQIAADAGITRSSVKDIVLGRCRRDLHPRIRAAAKKLPPDLRRRGAWWPGEPQGPPAARNAPDYDDDLMVELIARGELSYGQIARRLGVSRTAVAHIAAGHTRKDLQERINVSMRKHLAARRGHPARTVREFVECEKTNPAPKQKDYDDNLLIDLIARADRNYQSIARQVGLSGQTVRRIASGETRPELQPRIAAAADAYRRQAHRMGARWLWGLLAQHIRDGMEGEGPEARKCREFAMNFIENHGNSADARPTRALPTPGLTDEDYEIIARLKGGPPEDDEEDMTGSPGAPG